MYDRAKKYPLEQTIILQHMRFFGKIVQLPEDNLLRQAMMTSSSFYLRNFSLPRQRDRPRLEWIHYTFVHICRFTSACPNLDMTIMFNATVCKSATKEYICAVEARQPHSNIAQVNCISITVSIAERACTDRMFLGLRMSPG